MFEFYKLFDFCKQQSRSRQTRVGSGLVIGRLNRFHEKLELVSTNSDDRTRVLPLAICQYTGRGSHGNRAESSASPCQRSRRSRSDTCQSITEESQRRRRPAAASQLLFHSLSVPGAVATLEFFGGKPLDIPPAQLLGDDGALTLLEFQQRLKDESPT